MGPPRRSEKAPLADPLKTPNRSERVAKLTVETKNETLPEPLKAAKKNPKPAKDTPAALNAAVKKKAAEVVSPKQHYKAKEKAVEIEREYLAKRGFPGRSSLSKAGRIARQEHRVAVAQKASAEERVTLHRLREQEERAQLIAEYGEDEANCMRDEEREIRKRDDDLPTSDLEGMTLAEAAADPVLNVWVHLRINRALGWWHNWHDIDLSQFHIWEVETGMQSAIKNKGGHKKGWEINKIEVHIKAVSSRAPKRRLLIDDLSIAYWEDKIVPVIQKDAYDWKPELAISFEITGTTPPPPSKRELHYQAKAADRAAQTAAAESLTRMSAGIRGNMPSLLETPSGPPCGNALSLPFDFFDNDDEPTPKSRKTRTLMLEQKQAKEIEVLADVANYDYSLMKQYACNDRLRKNLNRFCFIDNAGDHYNVSAAHQKAWAKAIAHNEPNVSLNNPPSLLYKIWRDAGPVGDNKRTAAAGKKEDARIEKN